MFALILALATVSRVQEYSPPQELFTNPSFGPPTALIGSTTVNLTYYWWAGPKYLSFGLRTRPSGIGEWTVSQVERESVPFYMTAVAPIHAWNGHTAAIIVIGVGGSAANPVTVVQRWDFIVAISQAGATLSIQKSDLFESPNLTHIWAAAAVQDGSAIIGLHWESSDVIKVDLATGAKTVLLSKTQYPTLDKYGTIKWMQHVSQGDVFIFGTTRGHDLKASANLSMFLWDNDSNGVPDTIEEFPREDWDGRGYNDRTVWEPFYSFRLNLDAGT